MRWPVEFRGELKAGVSYTTMAMSNSQESFNEKGVEFECNRVIMRNMILPEKTRGSNVIYDSPNELE